MDDKLMKTRRVGANIFTAPGKRDGGVSCVLVLSIKNIFHIFFRATRIEENVFQ